MGWFDHNWVGVGEGEGLPPETADFSLHHSGNPFAESITITCEGSLVPSQLVVYDISGRIVRSLFSTGADTFLWDGRDSSGEELPAGTYEVRGASGGRLASLRAVKL